MLNEKRWFRLSLPDAVVRTMTRKEYYATMSYLRKCEREIAQRLDNEALRVKLSKLDTGAANGPVDTGIKTVSDEAIEFSVGRTKRTA